MFYPNAFYDWHAGNFQGLGQYVDKDNTHITNGLLFSVSGKKFNGKVAVFHIEETNYRIEFWKFDCLVDDVVVKKIEDVPYFDLAHVIDTYIN